MKQNIFCQGRKQHILSLCPRRWWWSLILECIPGAHFDLWVADYYDYWPGTPDSRVFNPPKICKDAKPIPNEGLRSFPAQMRTLAPAVHTGLPFFLTHTSHLSYPVLTPFFMVKYLGHERTCIKPNSLCLIHRNVADTCIAANKLSFLPRTMLPNVARLSGVGR